MNDPVITVLPGAAGGVEDGPLPFSAHLADLRKSILVSLAAVAAASLAAYGFADPVMRHIAHPVGKASQPSDN
jgi:Sec-independent protein secretion pathway component TatC